MDVAVETNRSIKMRDGCVLRADIYRPAEEGRYPAVMNRIPYGKDSARTSTVLDPVAAAATGLTVIVQDTRGQGASEGSAFYPFRDDFEDGFDTAEWIAAQPWSNGRVGAYGVSYGGNTSWQVAVADPPSLGAIAPVQSPIDWVEGWKLLTRDGVLKWGLALNWTLAAIAESQVRKYSATPAELERKLALLATCIDDFHALVWTRPMTKVSAILREVVGGAANEGDRPLAYFDDIVCRRVPEEWNRLTFERTHSRVRVPAFLVAGWYDVILGHDLEHFTRMRTRAATSDAADRTRLLVGPWSHSNFTNVVGDLDFGRRSMATSIDMNAGISSTLVEWFLSMLAGVDARADGPRVRLFVQGRNVWRDEDDWPVARARPVEWYLRADGRLSLEPPALDERPDAFLFDPADPCPTCGGDLVRPPTFTPGPIDQAPILDRRDVLVYTSDVLQEDLEVIGMVEARLEVATTAVGTDWVVKLCDVDEQGRTLNICDGIVRTGARDRHSCHVDLWGTAMIFRAGHRLRVIVTSSDFPRYERNPNTGQDPFEATRFEPAMQRVFHDAHHASRIVLPTVA